MPVRGEKLRLPHKKNESVANNSINCSDVQRKNVANKVDMAH